MKKAILTYLYLSFQLICAAQYFQASIDENLVYRLQPIEYQENTSRNQTDELKQIQGFPLRFPASQNAKNFRNVTLEDLDADGLPEIIFAAKDKLIALSKGTVLWEKPLIGLGLYPPSVADLNGDGDVEIVQATGGPNQKGRIYLMDANGNNWEGWPKNYEDHWIITAPTLSDLDGDGIHEIIFLERINSTVGQIHAVRLDGSLFNNNWPVPVPGTPAITPSVGDVDADGEKEIIVSTTTALYQFDLEGEIEPGWPIENADTKFSFQAPILRDLDGDGTLEIIGSTHGNLPEYYVFKYDGTPYKNWPIPVPQNSWSYSSPTVVKIDEKWNIFMSRPNGVSTLEESLHKDMLYRWNEEGEMQNGFPIEKVGGLQAGIITIADIDETSDMELIFGSTLVDTAGNSFIHAYKMDGSGEINGFPLRTRGWMLSNGAALGDINGDGNLNLVALSYTVNFGAQEDSIYLNIYDLEINHRPDNILWTTFKGNNTRDGLATTTPAITAIEPQVLEGAELTIFPNPTTQNSQIKIQLPKSEELTGRLYHQVTGKLYTTLFSNHFPQGISTVNLKNVPPGSYVLRVTNTSNQYLNYSLLVLK